MLTRDAPFVLLDDARAGGARLYRNLERVIRADSIAEVGPALEILRAARAGGHHAAGFLSYEASAAFEPRLPPPPAQAIPLLWFALFDDYQSIAAADVPALLPDPRGGWIGAPEPAIDPATYAGRIAAVLDRIVAGDIYQANLTFRATAAFAGDPFAVYARLRNSARAGHGAIVWTGAETLLSLSPEMFFSLEGSKLTARPMKGTARRGASPQDDAAAIATLAQDAKQRSENLMIVDLMRNDIGRVARPGSVAVPDLFTVETYPTIHQMVSTVTADLADGRDAVDVIAALFPCGSITGAPKIRAMEIIADVESAAPRGAYTGAIGRLDANGDALFNVAIRTLYVPDGADRATIGLGSGIVADSRATEEWDECLVKGDFVTAGQRRFDLIETMAFDPERGVALLDRHLARMKESATRFGFAFDRHAARNELQAATFRLREGRKVRLLLARSGAIAIEVTPLPAPPPSPVTVTIVPLPVASSDFRLRHKTSDRAFYDAARRSSGAFEVTFTDAEGWLTEGSFTSLFVERGDMLLTPPLTRGLLPGILRADLIDTGRAVEGDLRPDDLADGFFIGNAVRGLIPAVAIAKHASAAL